MFEAYLPHADLYGKRTISRFWELRPAQEMVRDYRLLRLQGVEHGPAFRTVVVKWQQRRNAIVRQQQIATNAAVRSGAALTMREVRPLLSLLHHLQMERAVGSADIDELARDMMSAHTDAIRKRLANGVPPAVTEAEVASLEAGYVVPRGAEPLASPYESLVQHTAEAAKASARGGGVGLVEVRDVPADVRAVIAGRVGTATITDVVSGFSTVAFSPLSRREVFNRFLEVATGRATVESLPILARGMPSTSVPALARAVMYDPFWHANGSFDALKNIAIPDVAAAEAFATECSAEALELYHIAAGEYKNPNLYTPVMMTYAHALVTIFDQLGAGLGSESNALRSYFLAHAGKFHYSTVATVMSPTAYATVLNAVRHANPAELTVQPVTEDEAVAIRQQVLARESASHQQQQQQQQQQQSRSQQHQRTQSRQHDRPPQRGADDRRTAPRAAPGGQQINTRGLAALKNRRTPKPSNDAN